MISDFQRKGKTVHILILVHLVVYSTQYNISMIICNGFRFVKDELTILIQDCTSLCQLCY